MHIITHNISRDCEILVTDRNEIVFNRVGIHGVQSRMVKIDRGHLRRGETEENSNVKYYVERENLRGRYSALWTDFPTTVVIG